MKAVHLFMLALLVSALPLRANGADKPTATVSGTVTYKGKPLDKGKISLYPKKGKPIVAAIKDGKFAFKATPVGPMRVAVTAKFLPKKYRSPETSGLTFDVAEGKNELDVQLK